jgi:hypothetical protein
MIQNSLGNVQLNKLYEGNLEIKKNQLICFIMKTPNVMTHFEKLINVGMQKRTITYCTNWSILQITFNLPYFPIDNVHLMYTAHPVLFSSHELV